VHFRFHFCWIYLYLNSCILTSFPLPFAQHFCLRVFHICHCARFLFFVFIISGLLLLLLLLLLLAFPLLCRRSSQHLVTLRLAVNQPYLTTRGKFMTQCTKTRRQHAVLTSSPGSASLLHLLSLILSIGYITSRNFNTRSEPSPLDFFSKITSTMTLHIFSVVVRQQSNRHGKALNWKVMQLQNWNR
jgi:hypothetical protein